MGFLVLWRRPRSRWRWKAICRRRGGGADAGAFAKRPLHHLGSPRSCGLALVILLGTSAPLLTRLAGKPSQVLDALLSRDDDAPADLPARAPLRARPVRVVEGNDGPGAPEELDALAPHRGGGRRGGSLRQRPRHRAAALRGGHRAFGFDMNLRAVVRKGARRDVRRRGRLRRPCRGCDHAPPGSCFPASTPFRSASPSRRTGRCRSAELQDDVHRRDPADGDLEAGDGSPGDDARARRRSGPIQRCTSTPARTSSWRTRRSGTLRSSTSHISPRNTIGERDAARQEPHAPARTERARRSRRHPLRRSSDAARARRRQDRDDLGALHRHRRREARAQTQTLEYVAHMDGSAPNEGRIAPRGRLPGSAMLIRERRPRAGMVQVNVAGLTSDFVPPTPETLSVDVTH